jgi:CDP-diacylglycerol--serine O-phosphatidyltransferase
VSDAGDRWIVSLTRAEWVTLTAMTLACGGIVAAVGAQLYLATALMLLALVADMADGALARRWGGGTDYGHALDTVGDVVVHLVLPALILYQLGMRDPISLAALLALIAAGAMRLAYFGLSGLARNGDHLYYVGMPVFYTHPVVAAALPLQHLMGDASRWVLVPILLVMPALMLRRRRFRKPTAYGRLAAIIIVVATVLLYLHVNGTPAP